MRVPVICALALLAACEEGRQLPTGPSPGGQGTRVDSGVLGGDGGASAPDAKAPPTPPDVGVLDPPDGGRPVYFDARSSDPGTDGGSGAFPDAAPVADATTSRPDAAAPRPDAAPAFPDAAPPPDSGPVGGQNDVWIEIDYSNANTSRSPAFRYSNTPGWGAAQWAAVNARGPEAWDRFNNMQVVNDPIGRSLEIGGGSELQLMIGLEELIAYDYATVIIEGRSRATASSVQYDVFNPWNGCGDSATLGNQWQVQSVQVDLAQCYEIGQGVQAVRVDPTNGTVALVRLRLTLHGAVY